MIPHCIIKFVFCENNRYNKWLRGWIVFYELIFTGKKSILWGEFKLFSLDLVVGIREGRFVSRESKIMSDSSICCGE